MAPVFSAIDVWTKRYVKEELWSALVESHALLHLMGLQSVESLQAKLGTPGSAAVFGSAVKELKTAESMILAGSKECEIRYQRTDTSDSPTTNVSYGGAVSSATAFASDRQGTYGIRWQHKEKPMKLRKHDLAFEGLKYGGGANANVAIDNILRNAIGQDLNDFAEDIALDLMTGLPSDQNAELWDASIGVNSTIAVGGTYGRVLRTGADAVLNGLVTTATAMAGTTVADLNFQRSINNGFGAVQGLATRKGSGQGAKVCLTTPAIFNFLSDQADGKHSWDHTRMEKLKESGFLHEAFINDGTVYIYDTNVTAGEMTFLNLDTWRVEINPMANFKVNEWTDKSRNEEGSETILWTNIEAMYRLICTAPYLNARVTGVTTS